MDKIIKHKHLIVRAECLYAPKSKESLKEWFIQLIKKIDMKLLSGPHVEHVDKEGNKGYTGVCIIETSHIALHHWSEVSPNLIQLDVYSCSDFNIEDILDHIEEWKPVKISYKFLDREHDLNLVYQDTITRID